MTTTLPSANPGILSFGTVIASPSPSPVVDKRYGGFCPSYVSTWGVDGQHFTQYATYVPCAGTAWASFATDTTTPASTSTAAGSAHAAQDAGYRLPHDASLGFIIGVSIGVPILLVLIGVAFLCGRNIAATERERLQYKYLVRGRGERQAEIDDLKRMNGNQGHQLNQAPAPAQPVQVVNPPNNPQT